MTEPTFLLYTGPVPGWQLATTVVSMPWILIDLPVNGGSISSYGASHFRDCFSFFPQGIDFDTLFFGEPLVRLNYKCAFKGVSIAGLSKSIRWPYLLGLICSTCELNPPLFKE